MKTFLRNLVRYALILSALLWPAIGSLADGPPPTTQTATLNAYSSVDQILQALYQRGQDLKDFVANVTKKELDPNTGGETSYMGTVRYQRTADGNVQIRVTFDHKKLGDNQLATHQEYRLTDGKLTIQKYDLKLEDHLVVGQPGQKINPLRLGEGAFPLPVGQEPQEVKKQFEVKLLPPSADDPPHTIHAQLVPKPDTRLAKKFLTIDVWVDMETNFTPRIVTVDTNGTVITTTDLTNLKINSGLKDSDFALPPPGKDWSIKTEEMDE